MIIIVRAHSQRRFSNRRRLFTERKTLSANLFGENAKKLTSFTGPIVISADIHIVGLSGDTEHFSKPTGMICFSMGVITNYDIFRTVESCGC